ncbi:MAG: hypothetical protein NTV46_08005 [Verrucomicrobia bacterium]|nr:hypothetical protein [Verrucomicrobiota bacterium]
MTHPEQWPHQTQFDTYPRHDALLFPHPLEPVRSPQQIPQHRLGLVIGLMP